MGEISELITRPYEPRDRAAVRKLCCDTGYLGQPIDSVFEDRELFADYLTRYYTDWEPESSFVLEQEGAVKGYLLGSRKPLRHQLCSLWNNLVLIPKGVLRLPHYHAASKRFVRWILANSWREVPAAPRRTAHFHFNILPEAQSIAGTRDLLAHYFAYLRSFGEKAVFGQVVTFESRRGARVFERFGFEVVNRSRITKWERLHPEPVYLCTVVKDLEKPDRYFRTDDQIAATAR